AEGIVAVESHDIVNFNFRSVDWPIDNTPSNWSIAGVEDEDEDEDIINQIEITITVSSEESEEPEANNGGSENGDENIFELALEGDGAIETLDWSAHQRAQAEESDDHDNAWDMFDKPDGVGRVQNADNPEPLEFMLVSLITEIENTSPDLTDLNLLRGEVEPAEIADDVLEELGDLVFEVRFFDDEEEFPWKEIEDDQHAENHDNHVNYREDITEHDILIIHRQAGNFEYRVRVSEDSPEENEHEVAFLPIQVQVRFPPYDDIIADQDVINLAEAKWERTKGDASEDPNRVRERGAWVYLDTTGLGEYQFDNIDPGPWVHPDDQAYITFSTPSLVQYDSPWGTDTGIVTDGGIVYLVANFHTHPPNVYGKEPNTVGASSHDHTGADEFKIVGLVYDYESGTGSIPGGHPLNSTVRFYHAGSEERRTRNPLNPNED
ncbi:MAG: hypothetical protein LAT55_13580, partial [Opitutales bacterium]|nr:hypothetical protein [Opitutales bacterium]